MSDQHLPPRKSYFAIGFEASQDAQRVALLVALIERDWDFDLVAEDLSLPGASAVGRASHVLGLAQVVAAGRKRRERVKEAVPTAAHPQQQPTSQQGGSVPLFAGGVDVAALESLLAAMERLTGSAAPANAKGFAEVGARARRAAQRALLLSELERQGWIMSRAAHELGMGTATAVIKALKSLGLAAEYEDARKRGVVMPGRRKG